MYLGSDLSSTRLPKADHVAAGVNHREHQAVSELVVQAGRFRFCTTRPASSSSALV